MTDETTNATAGSPDPTCNYWMKQLFASGKRLERWLESGKRISAIYEADRNKDPKDGSPAIPFNILYSNTETLLPALYNEIPRPVVQTRFKDEDLISNAACTALERGISFAVDNPIAGYEGLHQLFEAAVVSACVPGLGALQFSFDADILNYSEKASNAEEIPEQNEEKGDLDGQESTIAITAQETQQPTQTSPMPEVKNRAICAKYIPWNQIRWGFAKRWRDVPWIAIYWDMTKADVKASFGAEIADKLTYTNKDEESDAGGERKDYEKRAENTVRIWEIWHKSSRKIIFICENYGKEVLKEIDDPLGLTGFYSMPEPLFAFRRVDDLVPVALYRFYQRQAEELNRITDRILRITEAIKVRGFFDSSVGDLKQLFSADDNELIPVNGSKLMDPSGNGSALDKAIWLLPTEKLVTTLQTLLQARESIKQVIYEITGISDILRGASVASETATAQNIKNQWGSLRLKKFQKSVQAFVRDGFRIVSEIQSKHFDEQTWAKMTGLDYLTGEQKQQLEQQLQQIQPQLEQMQMQMQQAQPQQPPQDPNQPPAPQQPPQPPPEMQQLQQQMEQIQQQLQKPDWPSVLALVKDDVLRSFRIDVETNSTIDPEAAEDRQAVAEMLQAFTGTLQQLMPGAQSGVIPMPAVKGILKAMLKRFRFGTEVDQAINQIPDQLPNQPDPKQMEQMQKQIQQQQEKLQQGEQQMKEKDAEIGMKEKEFAMEQQMFEKEVEMAKKELEMQKQMALKEIEMAKQKAQMENDMWRQGEEMKISAKQQELEVQHQQKTNELQASFDQREMQRAQHWGGVKQGLEFERKNFANEQAMAHRAQPQPGV